MKTASKEFIAVVKKRLGDRVTTEMLQSQIEAVSLPCDNTDYAREQMAGFRRALAEEAAAHKLGIAAMGTFPLADWPDQAVTASARYDGILDELQMIGLRNMLCGMHVHVEVPDPDSRVDLMTRMMPYLPLLLALSASSPFWQGHLTGLHGYRLAAYDELPRSGLPELFRGKDEYDQYVEALTWARIIPDASYIWWAIRPSLRHPTLELRVCDCCTNLEDGLALAALFRCLVRALDRDRALNAGFDRVGRAITMENKWNAQRYGVHAVFVDPFRKQPMNAADWLNEVLDFIDADVDALKCRPEIRRLAQILEEGTSADRQIEVYEKTRAAGARLGALQAVVDWAAAETMAG